MRLRNLLILAIGVATISSCATSKKIRLADDLYKEGSFYNAVDAYTEVQQKKENNSRLAYQIAESNRYLKDYSQAEKWYTKTLEMNEKAWPEARFQNAMMMKAKGKYDKAIKEFDTFIDEAGLAKDKDGVLSALSKRAKMEKAGCELAMELLEAKQESVVEEIPGINHNLQDYAPKYMGANEVLMAALLPDSAINRDEAFDSDRDYYSKLFVSSNSNGAWANVMMPENINVKGKHNGNGVISKNGETMYYTQCAELDATGMTCDIYKSVKSGNSWGDPEFLSVNKKNSSTTQPALGLDANGNEVLYFASDRLGTKGGMDIYYATIGKDGSFGSATNMGANVNTRGDEVTPFYDNANGLLYFSSEGHPGMGGLDVFKVEGNLDNWSEDVFNAGYPLNSSADDLYLALNETGSMGYIVSNRPGTTSDRGETCCDDVFKVKLKRDKYLILQASDVSGKLMGGVDVSSYKVVGENDFDFIGEGKTGGKEPVGFLLEEANYKLNGSKEGFWPSIESLKMEEITAQNGDTITKVLVMRPVNRAVVENVYFAFDMKDIREMYSDEMDTVISLMMKYPELLVRIEGHTDSKGSDGYNSALSDRRAAEAKKYMLSKGISEERVIAKGFGETAPIAPNENPDGSDNPEGRAKNRRVEFKLLNDVNKDLPIEIEYEVLDPVSID
jgi:outer membrane protein OmpA-like peptidoglycan-associated protein/tetratricopeptide (TPR) repeat protein